MAFRDQQLPTDIEQRATVTHGFNTTIVQTLSGYEDRNQNWAQTRVRANIAYAIREKQNLEAVVAHFHAMRGPRDSFRFKNWQDYRVEDLSDVNDAQLIGIGDAAEVDFQITRLYEAGSFNYSKEVTKPISGTLLVYDNGVLQTEGGGNDYTVDYLTGIITFNSAPASLNEIRVKCEYDLAMRFEDDELSVLAQIYLSTGYELEAVPDITLIEVRGE